MHANGTLVDESDGVPLVLEIGDGQLDPCLESCVKEAKVGKLQTFLLSADESFGQIHDEAIQVVNRNEFPKNMHFKIDTAVEFKTPTGDSFLGCIDKMDGDDITVNFNHSLAGCDISFQVEILEKYENSQ